MRLAALVAILSTVTTAAFAETTASSPPTSDWPGIWAVFDEGVELVNLAVEPDGTVATTRAVADAARVEAGRWEATEDALFIRYESGRGETILRHAGGFRHVARQDDPESGERRTRVGSAFRITSPAAPYVGAWRVGGDRAATVLVLRSDGTGERLSDPRTTCLWKAAAGGAGIRWQDGGEVLFDPSRPGVRRAAPPAPLPPADD